MELRQLRYVTALAEELHFRRAAEVLDIAQPTLSQQISALEQELGVLLFERSQRSVRLTVAGDVFLHEIKTILAQVDLATNHVREVEAGRRGVIEIGSSDQPMSGPLPGLIRAFRIANPEVTLHVRIIHSNDVLEELKARRIHIGFARGGMESPELSSRQLWSFPYHVVLPRNHPQADKKSVQLGGLGRATLIMFPRSLIGESFDQVLAFCHEKGYKPKHVEEAGSLTSVRGLVACGFGISILPFTGEPDADDVVTRPIASQSEWRFPICAYWRTDGHSPLVEALLRLIADGR